MYNFRITDEDFAVGYLNAGSDSRHIRTGAGYKNAAKSVEIHIDEKIGLAWAGWGNMSCFTFYCAGQAVCDGRLREKAEKNPELAEDYLYIIDHMKKDDVCGYLWGGLTEHENDLWNTVTGWGGIWGGHAVPDFADYALLGTDGLREKINRYKAMNTDIPDFYDGMLMTLDALDEIGQRIHDKAKEMYDAAESDEARHKLARLVNTYDHCPKAPARTFAEAVAVFTLIFYFDGKDSPGHFDWYFGDLWDKSDYAESREALEDIWQFFHMTRAWNLCIGGSDENWNDKTNALTYEILDVCAKYKYNTPNLTMRCHRNTPEKLLRAAIKAIGSGTAMPTFYNDEAMCPAIERMGIPPRDSHLYVMNGCNQVDIQGKSHMGLEDGEVNLGMAVEYAIFNGVNQATKKMVGIETGDVTEFDSFEKFYDAVKAQLRYIIDCCCAMSNKTQRRYAKYTSNPLRSMTIEGCLERGLDYKDGGPLYNHGQILAHGVPDSIDSLAAIKKFVYDEKKYTFAEVRDALAANFEGYDEMYDTLKNSGLNFGNDIEYVDTLGGDFIDYYNSYLMTKPTARGGFFSGGCSPTEDSARAGAAVWALPNGKKAGEFVYGDSIGATPGKDVSGPTALLKSCLAFDHTLPTSGFILNVRFDSALFNSEKGAVGFLSLYKAFFDGKGQQLSVTVLNRDDLLDAKEHPEDHKNLIVRVGGFSGYFVELSPEMQENVIARTDHMNM
ncbi:MAG: hypothetical protein IJ386_03985 [Clostridia bacterium]|nr:hypothetical protein [Clostridia bacterium]